MTTCVSFRKEDIFDTEWKLIGDTGVYEGTLNGKDFWLTVEGTGGVRVDLENAEYIFFRLKLA